MNKILRNILLVSLLVTASQSPAEELTCVPLKLFGIWLGGVYDLTASEAKNLGNLPVKKFVGLKRFSHNGILYYFNPLDEYNTLEFARESENGGEKPSFQLFLLPVIPSTITTIEQLEQARLNWEIQSIGWSKKARTKEEAYNWAVSLCNKFKAEIAAEPEITDFFDSKWFECTFSAGVREFKINNINVIKSVELSFNREIIDAKDAEVEKIIKKLRTGAF
jgi:hypothetical protein